MGGPWQVAELLAVLFGFAYVWLAIREDARCWPVGIVNVAIYFFVFFHARLYASAVLQAVYVALSVYGWRQWLRGGESGGRLAVSSTPRRWAATLAAAGVAASLGLGLFLKVRTDAALPFPDAATTGFSLAAQWMTTRKWLESWLLWIVIDAAYVLICVSQRLIPMAVLYAVFLVMAVVGYKEWRASAAREGAALQQQDTP